MRLWGRLSKNVNGDLFDNDMCVFDGTVAGTEGGGCAFNGMVSLGMYEP